MEHRDKNGLTEAQFLSAYKPKNYERPSVTADIAVFAVSQKYKKILLIKRGGHPYLGFWALPGGFSKKNESVDETAKRELFEETHLKDIPLMQVGLFSKPGRDPRMWVMSEAYTAIIKTADTSVLAGDDAQKAIWFDFTAEKLDNGIINILFSAKDESFEIQLRAKIVSAADNIKIMTFETVRNGGLAFDHADIIAAALNKIGLI